MTLDTEYAPQLWDQLPPPPDPSRVLTTEQAFDQFRRRNPWFLGRLATMAYEARERGNKRVSMKALFEAIRVQVPPGGGDYQLNNSWTALAARRVMELYPDLANTFEIRKRRGE